MSSLFVPKSDIYMIDYKRVATHQATPEPNQTNMIIFATFQIAASNASKMPRIGKDI